VPIGRRCRNVVGPAPVVHPDHQQVLARAQHVGDVEVEGREAALVLAQHQAVHVDRGAVVGGAKVQEHPLAVARPALECALVPDAALVEDQARILGVPVTRHLEREAVLEGELGEVGRSLRLHSPGRQAAERGAVVGVDHRLPGAVQALVRGAARVRQQGIRPAPGVLRHRAEVIDGGLGLLGPVTEPQIQRDAEASGAHEEEHGGEDAEETTHGSLRSRDEHTAPSPRTLSRSGAVSRQPSLDTLGVDDPRGGSWLREEKESMTKKESAEKAVRDIRRRTRRRFSAEEKVRIAS
jgi:hypothetical protein